jgi:hypothetical protein
VVGVVAISLFVVTPASARSAAGGSSIASAPPLPLGQTVTSGWNLTDTVNNTGEYGEFWRVQMGAGDRIVIDMADTGGDSCGPGTPNVAIYAPSVTDFTISQSQQTASFSSGSSTKYEYVWVAPTPGNWTFFFDGCRQNSYTFNASLQLLTVTTLVPPPRLVSTGGSIPVHGTISGISSGELLVVVTGPKGFKRFGKVLPIHGGSFTWSFKPTLPGVYHFRASFPGDANHRPSSGHVASVRVA